jgi:cation diffusion facilitator family transporter
MLSGVVLVYFTLGQSQAMKAVFIEDVLALIPPIAFLVSARMRFRKPNERFPYGYHHSVSVGFLCSAVAILALGLFVLYEALQTLLTREHPTVGVVALFGHQVWLGWLAYPVLLYCIACEYTMGRLKDPLAKRLHDKALAADARMNRADWLSGTTAILGMTGIAFGLWWADALAAAVIAVEIIRDGWSNVTASVTDLMDEIPTKAHEDEEEDWSEKLVDRLKRCDWIRDVRVRLREEGNVFSGEVFVVPATTDDFARRSGELQQIARDVDWRFYDLSLVAVEKL